MGVTGFTGERRNPTGSNEGDGRRRRAGHGRRRPRPAVVRTPTPLGTERLEGRVLFAAAAAPVVSLLWKGQAVSAYQDQWVVKAGTSVDFTKVAARQGFTGVASLGLGYYQFSSDLSAGQIGRLAATHPTALGTVQPNMVVKAESTIPDDPFLPNQWGIDNTGQIESADYNQNGAVTPFDQQEFPAGIPNGGTTEFPTQANENHVSTAGDDIGTTQAWDVTTGSSAVVVAVLDTGIDLTNPDLVGNIFTNPLDTAANGEDGDGHPGDVHGYNFVADNADVTDDNGHGTAVAGIIGASGDNGQGVTGVNWHVTLLPVKVLGADGTGTTADVIAGINYVTNLKNDGINIVAINESLGGAAFPADVLENDAVSQAGKAGILDVVAAGNDALNIDPTGAVTPISYAAGTGQSGTQGNVITVAAVDSNFQLAAFSNYGSSVVNLAAPGVNIFSTFPLDTTVTQYTAELQAEQSTPEYYLPPGVTPDLGGEIGYGYESGTSLAAPFVTGTIALEAAANPAATEAQLKNALLKGVTFDPALAGSNGTAPKVATSGVVNAYQSVLDVMEPFDGTNTTRAGNWVGYYGSQGSYVVGDSTTLPTGLVDVTTNGGSPVVISNNVANPAALQRVSDPAGRVSAYEGSGTTETISLAFTDGNAHQTSLYVVDPDHKHRTETVSIVDPATGHYLDVETVSNFTKGEYLSWDLKGTVNLVISSVSGGAAYSGLFFDNPQVNPNTFQSTDATTGGVNWRSKYGSQGLDIFGDQGSQLPAYVQSLDVTRGTLAVLHAATKAKAGLQKTLDYNDTIEAYYQSPGSEDVNLVMTDGLTHVVTLYLADYNNQRRAERIQVIDSPTGNVLVTQNVNAFKNGEFVSFAVTGAVTFRIIRTGGGDAVVSGVFFDAAFGATAHFVGTNATLGGNYAAAFGSTAAYVVGDNFPGLDAAANSQIAVTGADRGVVQSISSNPQALYRVSTATGLPLRTEAYAFSTTSFTISYNPGDFVQHELSLYFADYEKDNRVESVTLLNPNNPTGPVLSHQLVTNFSKGKYLSFDVTGPVLIEINNGASPNAVLSGLFID